MKRYQFFCHYIILPIVSTVVLLSIFEAAIFGVNGQISSRGFHPKREKNLSD